MKKLLSILLVAGVTQHAMAFSFADIQDWWRSLTWGPYQDKEQPGLCPEHTPLGTPTPKLNYKRYYLCRTSYNVIYSPDIKAPEAVLYTLTPQSYSGMFVDTKGNDFMPDPQLERKERTGYVNYKDSPYVPLRYILPIETKKDQIGADETYFMSNTSPALKTFYSGVWMFLNKKVAKWTEAKGELYVITGPIYAEKPIKVLGKGKVPIPSHFYKILIDPKLKESITFVIPNEPILNVNGNIKDETKNAYDLNPYVFNINVVEKYVGLNLVPGLKGYPDNFKNQTTGLWGVGRKDVISTGVTKKKK